MARRLKIGSTTLTHNAQVHRVRATAIDGGYVEKQGVIPVMLYAILESLSRIEAAINAPEVSDDK